MEKVKTEDAVGRILASDVTEIVPTVKKGPLFKKGTSFHRLMPVLLSGYRLSKEEIIEMGEGGFIDA
ncbi:MAG: hypothetical protein GW894_02830 [Caldiserica bacterium]|nr:hypothetical protein [Caldisericota bacterium]